MRWWRARFTGVYDGLRAEQTASRDWWDPADPFAAGRLLAYHYSITGGERKPYM